MAVGSGPTVWTSETYGASIRDATPCEEVEGFSEFCVEGFLDKSLMIVVIELRVALIPTQNRVKPEQIYSSLCEAICIYKSIDNFPN